MKSCLYLFLTLLGVSTKLSWSFPSKSSAIRCSPRRHNINYERSQDRRWLPMSVVGQETWKQRSARLSPWHRTARSSTSLESSLLSTAITAVDAFWRSSPYAVAAIVCGVKASAADLVAQKRQMRKAAEAALEDKGGSLSNDSGTAAITVPEIKINKMRNVAYLIYGSVYQGMFQEYMYNHVYPAMFGNGTGLITVLSKVSFDLLFQTIFLTLPMAYLSKALIFRYSIKEAFRRYMDDIRNHGLLTKYFSLWGPVQCITFSIIPEHFRVTFIAGVSFFWLIILSSIASKPRVSISEQGKYITMPDDCPMEDGQTCELEFNDNQ
ncbi:Mpv17 / PMP22 family protein [Nitzschia inconspicua]|uniref:Mpv17 / PMP22 family protein n=1 Tax=Nitzschia inconspicua TaxID=303405 RepID=A0A9K3KY51_9STRA|nr:Mpv17 / PMP22 family protein [Nitzschia inconspicua]